MTVDRHRELKHLSLCLPLSRRVHAAVRGNIHPAWSFGLSVVHPIEVRWASGIESRLIRERPNPHAPPSDGLIRHVTPVFRYRNGAIAVHHVVVLSENRKEVGEIPSPLAPRDVRAEVGIGGLVFENKIIR